MVPVVVLAVIALVVIKTLMSVVAREEASTLPPWSPEYTAMTDPTIGLRATANDDAHGFLLPAGSEPVEIEAVDIDEAAKNSRGVGVQSTISNVVTPT